MSQIDYQISEHIISGVNRFFEEAPNTFLPSTSIDTVIFSFHQEKLRVLLLRFWDTGYYSLPGGYILKNEDIDAAAYRILQDRTGLTDIYLDQFYTSGSLLRSENSVAINTMKKLGVHLPPGNFMEQRFISICYYALVDEALFAPQTNPVVAEATWFDIEKIAELSYLFDHNVIIEKALQRLQLDLDQKHVGFNLLPDEFTMGELQKLYEAIYQTTLDRTSFQRKILNLNILVRLEKKYTGKAHKSPYLYRFVKESV